MTSSLSDVEAIVWDLDGTLYRYDHIFIEACNRAAAQTAIHLGATLGLDEALILARRSFEDWGSSSYYFCRDHGIDYRHFHDPYHASIDEAIIAKNQAMVDALDSLGLPMVILTNASRVWVKRILAHTNMDHLFSDETIVALEDVDFKGKASSTAGFEKAGALFNCPANKILMVEDLPRNLANAKQLGMVTALVHHGRIEGENAGHIDYQFQTTLELVQALQK